MWIHQPRYSSTPGIGCPLIVYSDTSYVKPGIGIGLALTPTPKPMISQSGVAEGQRGRTKGHCLSISLGISSSGTTPIAHCLRNYNDYPCSDGVMVESWGDGVISSKNSQ